MSKLAMENSKMKTRDLHLMTLVTNNLASRKTMTRRL